MGGGTSNAGSTGGGGTGAASGDATWLHTHFDSQLWQNPGGDFDSQLSAVTIVGNLGAYTWGPTDQMVVDVQRWLDDPSENFGWILVGDESRDRTTKLFASTQNSDTAERPMLRVEYTTGG